MRFESLGQAAGAIVGYGIVVGIVGALAVAMVMIGLRIARKRRNARPG